MEENKTSEVDKNAAALKTPQPRHLPAWAISLSILILAMFIFFVISGNWDQWESNQTVQRTDDAYVRGDVAALSTKASGIVSKMAVQEYQSVKAGQLIATIRDNDYQSEVDAAQAALDAAAAELKELDRQKQIADAKISQARAGLTASQALVVAAQAGVAAARASISAAQAGVASAEAQMINAQQERERQEGLFSGKASTLQSLQNQIAKSDEAKALSHSRQSELASAEAQLALRTADLARAQASVDSSQAEVLAALSSRKELDAKELEIRSGIGGRRAALDKAKISLGYTMIVAPMDGYIGSRNALPGQTVGPGTTLVTLVEGTPWVVANFKETQLAKMAPGDGAEVRVDSFPSKTWKGRVLTLAPQSGAESALIPPDNATGNFTKIVQRIPVKIVLEGGQDLDRLRPGMSATANVHTGTAK